MTPIRFCELVEARLGWEVPSRRVRWRVLMSEGNKVAKKVATNPDLYTWDNLILAVELCARERKSRTPLGVFAHVERALDLALDDEIDVEQEIREVVAYETSRGDPGGWVVRFARATGHYRRLALDEWKQAER